MDYVIWTVTVAVDRFRPVSRNAPEIKDFIQKLLVRTHCPIFKPKPIKFNTSDVFL